MKTLPCLAVAALVTTMSCATARAADLYVGGKAGFMHANASRLDDPLNVGVSLGMKLQESPSGAIGLEGEYSSSVRDGDQRGGGDWSVDTLGFFGTYRTTGPIYLKAKAGIADQNVKGTSRVDDETTFAFGVGAGVKTGGKTGLELEFTVFDHLNFISLGFNSAF